MREYRKHWTEAQKEKNREWQRKYREKHKEKINQKNKLSYSENPDVFYQRRVRSANNNPEQVMLENARRNATRHNREFNLDLSDIVIPEVCPFLKVPLIFDRGKGLSWNAPSIDRIDSSMGYVKGNVQILSRKANMMKSNATQAELIQFAKSILEGYDE